MRNISLILFLCFVVYGQAQIVVDTDTHTVEQLVSQVLVNSNCAVTSNYSSFTGTAQGVNGIGYFSSNNSGFQFEEGIVLSTGEAVDSEGPNNRRYNTHPKEWLGDADLSQITGRQNLSNASYIQFDFIPRTNRIGFNFLFASEEYDENYQCSFSDVFAFILTGPDGKTTNMALIPKTNEAVSATSIRPGIPNLCEPANAEFFHGVNGSDSPISQYGQTVSLTASSEVVPLATYTLKMVIADNLDEELDSAVYLEAGSFSNDIYLGDDRTFAEGNPLCDGESVTLDASAEDATDYIWYRDGVELKAERNQPSTTVNDDGVYSVEIVFSPHCHANGTIALEFAPAPVIVEEPVDMTICIMDDTTPATFDFTNNSVRILGDQDPEIYHISYHRTIEDAENFQNPIENIDAYTGEEPREVVHARVATQEDCFALTSFEINVERINFTSDLGEKYTLCLDSEGRPKEPYPILDTGLSGNDYSFQWYRDNISKENSIPNAVEPSYIAMEEGQYIVLVQISEFGCELSLKTLVNTSRPPDSVTISLVSELFASNTVVEVQVDSSDEYFYSIDDGLPQQSNRFSDVGPGQHTIMVGDTYGCSTVTEEFFIIDYPRFFTPNGDGTNDTWSIIGVSELEDPEIHIYDRYGKLVYQLYDTGWDGRLNGRPLPSSDYWFRISYAQSDGRKEYKGHFSLKR